MAQVPGNDAASRVAYVDCFSGASGNMILGALIDCGLEAAAVREAIRGLTLGGFRLEVDRVVRSGLAGTLVRVAVVEARQPSRHLADIAGIIGSSALSAGVKERALAVFERLATVEARIHGTTADQVHFHEVGAVDAIVDVVGCAVALEQLGIDRVHVSALPLGHGSVKSEHGVLPLPAPATLALLAEARAPTRPVDVEAELVTPTGAALLTTLGAFGQPPMTIERVGVGFGTRLLPWPNVLRVWVGAAIDPSLIADEVTVIETNLDDCPPEQAGYAMERLLEAGALDVFFTPVQMKKNRPGVLLTVLAEPARADTLATVVLRETTSLGVRFRVSRRLICPRRSEVVATELGPMQVKIKVIDGREVVCPEYEECVRVARERRVPIGEAYAAVLRAGRAAR